MSRSLGEVTMGMQNLPRINMTGTGQPVPLFRSRKAYLPQYLLLLKPPKCSFFRGSNYSELIYGLEHLNNSGRGFPVREVEPKSVPDRARYLYSGTKRFTFCSSITSYPSQRHRNVLHMTTKIFKGTYLVDLECVNKEKQAWSEAGNV